MTKPIWSRPVDELVHDELQSELARCISYLVSYPDSALSKKIRERLEGIELKLLLIERYRSQETK